MLMVMETERARHEASAKGRALSEAGMTLTLKKGLFLDLSIFSQALPIAQWNTEELC